MARRSRGNRPWARTDKGYGGAGFASSPWESECHRCGGHIADWGDAAKTSKGQWVHKTCMAGADDT